MEYRLVSLSLPKNSDMSVILIQNRLFREFGYTSALCLPVSIPLFFLNPKISRDDALRSLDVPGQSFPIECTELIGERGCFFLRVEPENAISGFARQISQSHGMDQEDPDRMLIPVRKGIFVSCNETSIPFQSAQQAVGALPPLRFSSFSLTVTDVLAEGVPWWTNVSWEIIYEKRLYRNTSGS
jgi:hypothetical protein